MDEIDKEILDILEPLVDLANAGVMLNTPISTMEDIKALIKKAQMEVLERLGPNDRIGDASCIWQMSQGVYDKLKAEIEKE